MSDQDKPQKWTVEMVEQIRSEFPIDWQSSLVFRINADLAADREKVKDFRAELHSALEANELLVQQLAEELEKSVDAVREVTLEHAEQSGRQIKEIRELRDQLAAGREAIIELRNAGNGLFAANQTLVDALKRIARQQPSEQACIAEVALAKLGK